MPRVAYNPVSPQLSSAWRGCTDRLQLVAGQSAELPLGSTALAATALFGHRALCGGEGLAAKNSNLWRAPSQLVADSTEIARPP